jgi:tetratricopeptide (TPR) repeat protein
VLTLTAAMGGCAPLPQVVVLEDPLTAEEHVALGVAYERRGELEPAAREYERALKKDRSSFRAHLNLANVRLAQKRYGEARETYLKALGLRPLDPEATNNLAWVAILSGQGHEEALRRLDAVLAGREAAAPAADGLTPVLLDTRGVLLGRLGRRAEAEAALALAEAICLAAGTAPAPLAAPPGAAVPCPAQVLSEIRMHREELQEHDVR